MRDESEGSSWKAKLAERSRISRIRSSVVKAQQSPSSTYSRYFNELSWIPGSFPQHETAGTKNSLAPFGIDCKLLTTFKKMNFRNRGFR